MAAGVGNALAVADALALLRVQLRQAVGPGRVHPVGRAGVDDAGGGVVDQGHRFAGSCVGQAQEGNIGRVQQSRPLGRVLAQRRVDAQHRDIAAPAQILVDLQTGRSFLSIYKDLVNTHLFIIPGSCHAARRRPEARDLLAPAQGDARCMAPCTSCPGFRASAALADAGAPIVCHNPGEVMPFPPDFRSLPVAVFPKRGMAFPRQRPPCQNYSLALPEPSFT